MVGVTGLNLERCLLRLEGEAVARDSVIEMLIAIEAGALAGFQRRREQNG
ncbi:MAG: hypothetical protein MI920_01990 [Kiloniellales bacterium]|nr:hypothetical protein [Kiloniellales bacterium]